MEKLESDLRDYAIDLVNRNVCAPHQLGDYLSGYLAQDTLSGNGHLARIAARAQPQIANSADGGETQPGQQQDGAQGIADPDMAEVVRGDMQREEEGRKQRQSEQPQGGDAGSAQGIDGSDMADMLHGDMQREEEDRQQRQGAKSQGGAVGSAQGESLGERAPSDTNRAESDAVGTMRAIMRIAGVNLNPALGSKEAKKLADIDAGLDKALADAKTKTGGTLTPDEEKNVVLDYVAGHVLKEMVEGKVQSKLKGHKSAIAEDEAVPAPTEEAWQDIAKIAGPMRERVVAGTLKYGHTDKNYEEMTGRKGQVSELQKRLGITVTGVFDKRTFRAVQKAFVAMILPSAEEAEKNYHIPVAVTIGQAWLESTYGLHTPIDVKSKDHSYNLFGVKAKGKEDYVTSWTKERDADTGTTSDVLANFARYRSFEDAVNRHSIFLKDGSRTFRHNNPGYDSMFSTSDPNKWADGLEKAGYATGANYAQHLKDSIRDFEAIKKSMKIK